MKSLVLVPASLKGLGPINTCCRPWGPPALLPSGGPSIASAWKLSQLLQLYSGVLEDCCCRNPQGLRVSSPQRGLQ